MDISIIIPVYFNEGSINKTYEVLKNEVFSSFPDLKFEVIFIDDGSKDGSLEEVMEVKASNEGVRVIQFSRNFGQVAAIYAGYETAVGKGILNIAADLQDPVSLIMEMVASFINEDAPIILGQRIDRNESRYRKLTPFQFKATSLYRSFEKNDRTGTYIIEYLFVVIIAIHPFLLFAVSC